MGQIVYPPGPTEKIPGRLLLKFRRDPVEMLMKMARQYGDIAHFRLGFVHSYMLNRPEYIKDVLIVHNQDVIKSRGLQMAKSVLGEGLLTSEGEFHDHQRRLIRPAFHHEQIVTYTKIMTSYAARYREKWQDGEILDIHKEMMKLTMAIVAKALFNADVESEADVIGETVGTFLEFFSRVTNPLAPLLERLPLPSNKRFQRAKERLDSTIYRIIDERSKSGEDPGDLLSMLLHARDESSNSMTDQQLRDEIVTLFLAGHETTANALTWTWYLLSQHLEVESKLHAELESVLGDRLPAAEHVSRLSYTAKVLTESMRLYPPAWVVTRQILKDIQLGAYVIPAKSVVFMSQYVMHHNPRYYAEPEHFNPERWTPEMKTSLPRFAYFPFGGGQRSCIGEPFAWIEGLLLIATIAQEWRMRLVPDHPVALLPRITLRPKYGMRMHLANRRD